MSSATVMFVLKRMLNNSPRGKRGLAMAFGPGVVAETFRLSLRLGGRQLDLSARLRRAGWQVSFTPAVGDYGVDLIDKKDGQSVAIQCKRHGKSVGGAAAQQVVSGALHHGCTKSIVVSNQEFAAAAKQLAYTHRCQLIGRRASQAWVPPPTRRAV
jgi:hypothetical protein